MFHNLAVPVLHLFISIVTFLYLYVDELKNDDVTIVNCAPYILFNTPKQHNACLLEVVRRFRR